MVAFFSVYTLTMISVATGAGRGGASATDGTNRVAEGWAVAGH